MAADDAPQGLAGAVASGDRRAALTALRDDLARRIEAEPDSRMVPQLVAQLRAVMADLADVPATEGASPLDELRRRRQQRAASAS